MKTEKRYWTEPFVFEGGAKIVEIAKWKDRPAVVLDSSLFYPEGGGQKGDRGEVVVSGETIVVLDTQVDEAGQIFLVLEKAILENQIGSTITCRVNEDWRRRQMSQHTGQHMLSRLLHDEYHAPTVSARLGETNFSLEIDSATITWEQLAEAETKLNKLILEDRPIRAWFPSPEELATLDLRKQPSVTEGIRIIQVEGFDVTPCGGTHCARTGQVGIVHIQSMERYKGMTRLFVSVGLDAACEFQQKERTLQAIQAVVDANNETVVKQVEVLHAQSRQLKAEKECYMVRAAEAEAKQLVRPEHPALTVVSLNEVTADYARLVSKQLASLGKTTAIISCLVEGSAFVVVDRGGDAVIDVGATLKQALTPHLGKGGGSAIHAEGRIASVALTSFLEDLEHLATLSK